MTVRTAARLAWSACALSLALTALSLLLLKLSLSYPNTYIYDYWLDNTLGAISFAPVGALIASRRPANPVGWLMCLYGLAISIETLVPSTPSILYWHNPTRYQQVKRLPGSLLGYCLS